MTFVGIDPGKSGALAKIVHDEMYVYPTPVKNGEYDIPGMTMLLVGCMSERITFCVIERAQAMPGQGVVSMFEFGKGYGIWLALLSALVIPYQVVHSRVWTKQLLAGSPGEGKDRNVNAAKHLFPSWVPRFKKEEAYCDAILLAEYARRIGKIA